MTRSPRPWAAPPRSAVEPLERRVCLSTAGTATGTVVYEYPLVGGGTATVPLADRTVYDDVADTGTYAAGDPVAVTDLTGTYTLALAGPSQTIRVLPRPGWAAAAGSADNTVASPGDTVGPLALSMTDPTVINVQAGYTSAATEQYGPAVTNFGTTIDALFAYANEVEANSDTNILMNLVGTTATAYTESGSLETDLQTLSSAGAPADVAAARRADGADLTVLFEGDVDRGTNNEIGLAYEFDHGHPTASEGDAIVSLLGNTDRDGKTLAHELGHLLGADHDPAHTTGIGDYPYARGLVFTGDDGAVYQDVMSYGSGTILPYYSDPGAFYAGHALGLDANGDNARAVRLDGPIVARYVTTGDEGSATAGVTPLVQAVTVKVKGKTAVLGSTAGTATVALSNPGPATVAGTASVTLSLVDAAGTVTPITTASVSVNLRGGQARSVPVKFTWPSGAAAGAATVEAVVTVGGTTAVAGPDGGPFSSAAITYQPPTVALSASTVAAVSVRSGRAATVRVQLHNAGNVKAVGTVSFAGTLTSTDDAADAPIAVTVAARPLSVAAGKTQALAMSVPLPSGLATGTYQVTLQGSYATSPADVDPTDGSVMFSLTVT
jgi:hypothetical protein